MAGFYEGRRHRVQGIIFKCEICGRELDESNFSFGVKCGYYSMCRECNAARVRKQRLENKPKENKYIGADLHREKKEENVVPDTISVEELKNRIAIGDVFKYKKQILVIERITVGYVLMRLKNGAYEAFQWDDMMRMYKSKNNEKRSGSVS